MRRELFWPVLGLFCALLILPFLLAQMNSGQDFLFGGFLLNPLDGNTYLAKMEEGRQGAWQYTLPFTAEKSGGALLFMFYLLLGHLARLSGLPLLLVFHLARLAAAVFLAFSIYEFCNWVFENNFRWAQRAFVLVLMGSGLGWLGLALGWVTSDLWVAEAYPFLSAYVNPHFALGMGLLLQILVRISKISTVTGLLGLAGMGLALAVVMPFGVVVAGLVSGVWCGVEWLVTRKIYWKSYLAAFCLAGPALIYQYWATQNDPLLSLWNAQNVTPAPPVWDFIVAFSPALGLAFYAVWRLARRQMEWNSALRLQVSWLVVGLVLVYFPFALQRRFMFALFVPVAVLAIVGLRSLSGLTQKMVRRSYSLLLVLSLLTNVVVLILAGFGVLSHLPALYFTKDEAEVFAYIRGNLPTDAVILCSPELGNLLPGWTGRRVLYGHDFETVNAPVKKKLVTDLLADVYSPEQAGLIIQQNAVQYILLRPQGQAIPRAFKSLVPVYQNDTVSLYHWQ